jgi:altronate hydrolase
MSANHGNAVTPTIRLHAADDVVIARHQLISGARIAEEGVTVSGLIPAGHKVAVRRLAADQPVRRYNQIIGVTTRPIEAGQHVHTHNLAMAEFARDYAYAVDAHPTLPADTPASFEGIVRADGRVATRNYLGILTSVNCSATVAHAIADHFRRDIHPEALAGFPNVDGVVALTHGGGCGIDTLGLTMKLLRRTLAGYAIHPNFHSVLMIGLGCEANQIGGVMAEHGLDEGERIRVFTIQDTGGTTRNIA